MTDPALDLPAILASHLKWLRSELGGTRADLTGAYLTGVNLTGVNLTRANLTRANLTGVNLIDAKLTDAYLNGAYLTGADLIGVNLIGANLTGVNLIGANLTDANLTDAYLTGAYLTRAKLIGADLTGADLIGANLIGADLIGANLNGANLNGAYLTGANLTDAKGASLSIARTRILPSGSIVGWKKCLGGVIVKLRIPEEAKRSHAFGRKCRAEYVDVLEVIGAESAVSCHSSGTIYKAGERVKPDSFSDKWQEECAPGIHFFITREEAEDYNQ